MVVSIRRGTALFAMAASCCVLVVTLVVVGAWRSGAAPGDDDATFVPTPGCRAFDYRSGDDQVGPRSTPLGAGEVHTQQITGGAGNCTGALAIPGDAVAVSMNVTAVNPTAQSNLRLFPADLTEVPLLSNLNFSAGQPPFPNKVDVKLSPSGAIKLFNQFGSVSVVGDVVGYYTSASLTQLAESLPFAVSQVEPDGGLLPGALSPIVSVQLSAPVSGKVTVSSHANVTQSVAGNSLGCIIVDAADAPFSIGENSDYAQVFKAADGSLRGSLSGVRTFDITAGTTGTFQLRCRTFNVGGGFDSANITALFTPTPTLTIS